MKKIFPLQQENKHPDRVLDSIKYEIRKYFKRERSKKLPPETSYWEFDCAFGKNKESAHKLSSSELISALDKAHEENWQECFIEIISKPVYKAKSTPKK